MFMTPGGRWPRAAWTRWRLFRAAVEALGVGPEQYVDGVPGPLGDLGGLVRRR
jgi:hypothetical protein